MCILALSEREAPPRFAHPGTLEFEVASRWKAHYESERVQREELEQNLKQARNALQSEMQNMKEQHQTMLLRQGEGGGVRLGLGEGGGVQLGLGEGGGVQLGLGEGGRGRSARAG